MIYFVFLIALITKVSGYNYYANQNFENYPLLVQYENQNLFGQENLYNSKSNNPTRVEVLNYDNLGPGSCPNTKQPLCATNGQLYIYFENPCQLEIKNFEELIEERQEYFQCPLELCQTQCSQCPDTYDPACVMEVQTGQIEIFKNSCEVDRKACLTKKDYRIVSRTKCPQLDTQCPQFCTREYKPICAKFNNELREFSNNCEFKRTRCETNNDWQIEREGPCFPVPYATEPQPPRCPDFCSFENRPICAKFNNELREFENDCEFQRTRCQTSTDWQIVHEGPCFPLPGYTKPQVPQCPDFCTFEYKPICAKFKNELREFGNICELQRTSCQTNDDWQIEHEGPCLPVLNTTESLIPRCTDFCTLEFRPICAKFNNELRQFGNNCELQRTRCKTNDDWQVVNMGPCPENTTECPKFCTEEFNPICAKYGYETREFSNSCELKRISCETNINWQIVREGPCFPVPDTREPLPPKCPDVCTLEYRPVCAKFNNELREFGNACALHMTRCQTNNDWQVVNTGPCPGNTAECPKFCTKEFNPICAKYGYETREFSNKCELKRISCETNIYWQIVREGPCFPIPDTSEPLPPKCPDVCTLEYRPVCAKFNNELREFGNACALHVTRCQTNNDWQVVNIGPCPSNTTECPKFCTREFNPICAKFGSEIREFSNSCELKRISCETNTDWYILYNGKCFNPTSLEPYTATTMTPIPVSTTSSVEPTTTKPVVTPELTTSSTEIGTNATMPITTTETPTSSVYIKDSTLTTTNTPELPTTESTTLSSETTTTSVDTDPDTTTIPTSTLDDDPLSTLITTTPLTESTSFSETMPTTTPYTAKSSYYGSSGANYGYSGHQNANSFKPYETYSNVVNALLHYANADDNFSIGTVVKTLYNPSLMNDLTTSYNKNDPNLSLTKPKIDKTYNGVGYNVPVYEGRTHFSPYNQPFTANNPFFNYPGILVNPPTSDYSQIQPYIPFSMHKSLLSNNPISINYGAQPPSFQSRAQSNALELLTHISKKYGSAIPSSNPYNKQQLTEQSASYVHQPQIYPPPMENLQFIPNNAAQFQSSQMYPQYLHSSFMGLPMPSDNPAKLPPIYSTPILQQSFQI